MKKLIFSVLLVSMQVVVLAQVSVTSVSVLPGTDKADFYHPAFAANGEYLLLTSVDFQGLTKYDLKTNEMTKLTDAVNAGYAPQISDGGKVVVFRDVEYKNNRRYTSIKSINLENRQVKTIDKASREMHAFAFVGGKVNIASKEQIISKRLATDIRTVNTSYIVAIEDQSLVLYTNNVRKVLNPNGNGSYIWPSVSPDQKHIVYMSLNKGCNTYVCDMEGKNCVNLGYIAAPVWMGNNWIVGMEDKDDGHQTLSSTLKAARIDGSLTQEIPTPNKIVMYPAATENAIAYVADGAVYLIKVEIR
ncbi:MAG: hypothetical protein PHH23_09125 [Paludibacteraceae bacterium]|nr:hypothetical protein [Paludibacteraceae bacterium]